MSNNSTGKCFGLDIYDGNAGQCPVSSTKTTCYGIPKTYGERKCSTWKNDPAACQNVSGCVWGSPIPAPCTNSKWCKGGLNDQAICTDTPNICAQKACSNPAPNQPPKSCAKNSDCADGGPCLGGTCVPVPYCTFCKGGLYAGSCGGKDPTCADNTTSTTCQKQETCVWTDAAVCGDDTQCGYCFGTSKGPQTCSSIDGGDGVGKSTCLSTEGCKWKGGACLASGGCKVPPNGAWNVTPSCIARTTKGDCQQEYWNGSPCQWVDPWPPTATSPPYLWKTANPNSRLIENYAEKGHCVGATMAKRPSGTYGLKEWGFNPECISNTESQCTSQKGCSWCSDLASCGCTSGSCCTQYTADFQLNANGSMPSTPPKQCKGSGDNCKENSDCPISNECLAYSWEPTGPVCSGAACACSSPPNPPGRKLSDRSEACCTSWTGCSWYCNTDNDCNPAAVCIVHEDGGGRCVCRSRLGRAPGNRSFHK